MTTPIFEVQQSEDRFVIYVPLIRDWLEFHVYETRSLAELAVCRLSRNFAVARVEHSYVKLYALDRDIPLHAIATFSSEAEFTRLMGKTVEEYNRLEPSLNLSYATGIVMRERFKTLAHELVADHKPEDAFERDVLNAYFAEQHLIPARAGKTMRYNLTDPHDMQLTDLAKRYDEKARVWLDEMAMHEKSIRAFEQSMGIVSR